MKKKFRVAIHTLAIKRDIASRYVLSKLLEHHDCEVCLTSVRTYARVLKYWRPHGFVSVISTKVPFSIKTFPDAKFFHCAGEGAEYSTSFDEQHLLENERIFDKLSRIYLWGDVAKENMLKKCDEFGKPHLKKYINSDGKVLVNGHPRVDVSRYMPRKDSSSRNSIGFVGRFPTINDYKGTSTLHFGFVREFEIREAELELKLLRCYLKIIDYIIDYTSFNISIRPYPAENSKQYFRREIDGKHSGFNNRKYNGRIEIDDSLDFSSWCMAQKAIISSQSTMITEAYLMDIPAINIDKVAGAYDAVQERGEKYGIHNILMEAPYQPNTYKELFSALLETNNIPINKHKLEELWDGCYNLNQKGSVLNRMAKDIVKELESGHHSLKPLLGLKILKLYDNYSFYKACKKEPFHPCFYYKEGYHEIPSHYDEIVKNILNESIDHQSFT